MSSHKKAVLPPPLDLSKWRKVPTLLIVIGGLVTAIGAGISFKHDGLHQFAFSWLLAYMFFLSVCAGGLFLVLVHHLFDAGWSVPIRRFCEHIGTMLFPWMAILWIPIALLRKNLYAWMSHSPASDHALKAKQPLFTEPMFFVVAGFCFLAWWLLSNRLRYWSMTQDVTGGSKPTYKMRFYACWGIFAFAITLTLAVIMWMKALQHEFFSTMYGVYYFAGSVWMTLGLVYVITMILQRQRILDKVLHEHQFYFIGSLMFAFTVFYAYVHFAQYFIIWNGNMPEETFWYVVRERGTWFWIGMIIIFGHFFMPFLGLLRIDVKSIFPYMVGVACWAWLMHYFDLSFNIHPVAHPEGFPWKWIWLDFGCMALIGGILAKVFLAKFASAPPYPLKDPRLVEAMGLYHPVPTQLSGGEVEDADDMHGAPGH
ncbi:MAG: hypothetical protein U1F65_07030 [Verrucomicrobiota bacterium]